ncbi:hypothetical protein FA13DRAFT_148038 [Coprinellus micaceus]|uniref:Uncharacterized protein n=1 Tax=Coprinellus micaceus TaxID=71717 RepID=A0A4Y7TGN8_COPMI|nr:hypothetical protein FA13DRAFT_148038 [Coprinellus micaceus]
MGWLRLRYTRSGMQLTTNLRTNETRLGSLDSPGRASYRHPPKSSGLNSARPSSGNASVASWSDKGAEVKTLQEEECITHRHVRIEYRETKYQREKGRYAGLGMYGRANGSIGPQVQEGRTRGTFSVYMPSQRIRTNNGSSSELQWRGIRGSEGGDTIQQGER